MVGNFEIICNLQLFFLFSFWTLSSSSPHGNFTDQFNSNWFFFPVSVYQNYKSQSCQKAKIHDQEKGPYGSGDWERNPEKNDPKRLERNQGEKEQRTFRKWKCRKKEVKLRFGWTKKWRRRRRKLKKTEREEMDELGRRRKRTIFLFLRRKLHITP